MSHRAHHHTHSVRVHHQAHIICTSFTPRKGQGGLPPTSWKCSSGRTHCQHVVCAHRYPKASLPGSLQSLHPLTRRGCEASGNDGARVPVRLLALEVGVQELLQVARLDLRGAPRGGPGNALLWEQRAGGTVRGSAAPASSARLFSPLPGLLAAPQPARRSARAKSALCGLPPQETHLPKEFQHLAPLSLLFVNVAHAWPCTLHHACMPPAPRPPVTPCPPKEEKKKRKEKTTQVVSSTTHHVDGLVCGDEALAHHLGRDAQGSKASALGVARLQAGRQAGGQVGRCAWRCVVWAGGCMRSACRWARAMGSGASAWMMQQGP